MKKVGIVALALLACASIASADLFSASMTVSSGVGTIAGTDEVSFSSVTWNGTSTGTYVGGSIGAGNNTAGSALGQFTITIVEGYELTLASLNVNVQSSGTGPGVVSWSITGDDYAFNTETFTITQTSGGVGQAASFDLSGADVLTAGTYTFTYVLESTVSANGTGTVASGGTSRLYAGLTLSGDLAEAQDPDPGVVPEPTTMALLGLGALAVAARRRMSK